WTSDANCASAVESADAAKGCVDIGIPRPEPVSERRTQQLARRGRRGAFHHEMFLVEEVRGVFGVRRQRREAREWRERRARPLPAVANEIVNAPCAPAVRTAACRLRIPTREIEHA